MKKIIFAALAAAAISTASAATYKVDEYHANARFAIDHFNTSTNVGGFYGLTGSVEFDQAKRDGKIDITIPIANLQSGSQHFTDHLKSADIFDAAQYLDIRFVSTKFNFNGKKLVSVDGNLTMHGKTAPSNSKPKNSTATKARWRKPKFVAATSAPPSTAPNGAWTTSLTLV